MKGINQQPAHRQQAIFLTHKLVTFRLCTRKLKRVPHLLFCVGVVCVCMQKSDILVYFRGETPFTRPRFIVIVLCVDLFRLFPHQDTVIKIRKTEYSHSYVRSLTY